jgi:hypothetical protein
VYHDEYELHLPTGRTAGHRSLNKYYRQNLRNYPGVAERMERQQRLLAAGTTDEDGDEDMDREDREDGRRGRQLVSRANGGLGMIGVSDEKKKEVAAVEKRERRREQRIKNNYQAGNEKRGNFQKHFRVCFPVYVTNNGAMLTVCPGPSPSVIAHFLGPFSPKVWEGVYAVLRHTLRVMDGLCMVGVAL